MIEIVPASICPIHKIAYTKTEAEEFARKIGANGREAMAQTILYAGELDGTSLIARKATNAWFRFTQLERWTVFTRKFAALMANDFLIKQMEIIENGYEGDEAVLLAKRHLKDLGVTPQQIKAYKDSGADIDAHPQVKTALGRFVDESIVRPNPAQRPTYANDPRYALIWQLKSFFYAYGKTIVFPTLKESHRNFVNKGAGAGAMPLLFMASVLLPITMLGLEIREFWKAALAWLLPGINPNDPGVDYFKTDNMSMGQYMTEILDRSGMLGPYTMALPLFMESKRYGQPFWVPPLGPTAERVYDGITWDWQAADYIPVYSQLDTRALQR